MEHHHWHKRALCTFQNSGDNKILVMLSDSLGGALLSSDGLFIQRKSWRMDEVLSKYLWSHSLKWYWCRWLLHDSLKCQLIQKPKSNYAFSPIIFANKYLSLMLYSGTYSVSSNFCRLANEFSCFCWFPFVDENQI